MYYEEVKTLTLEQIPLVFKTLDKEIIPKTALLVDFASKIENSDSPYLPDMGIRGWYQAINRYHINQFIIDPKGGDMLFITGVPLSNNRDDFRQQKPSWIGYFQDNKTGYLFQITKI